MLQETMKKQSISEVWESAYGQLNTEVSTQKRKKKKKKKSQFSNKWPHQTGLKTSDFKLMRDEILSPP